MTIETYLAEGTRTEGKVGLRYIQLRHRLESAIAEGILKPGAMLPSERAITEITGYSRVTVRKAIGELVARGAIIQKQGSGSFVAAAPAAFEQSLSSLTSFTNDMKRRDHVARSEVLERGIVPASPEEVVALALSPQDSVARLSRLRLAGDVPMAIENATLPTDILSDPEAVGVSLYETLAALGNAPTRALQKLRAVSISEEEAETLNVPVNSAGLRTERISYLPSGRPIEFTRSIYRGDMYDFVVELKSTDQV